MMPWLSLCRRICQLFQEHGNWRFMTVSATLQEGGERNAFFCNEARALYARLKSKAIEEGGHIRLARTRLLHGSAQGAADC